MDKIAGAITWYSYLALVIITPILFSTKNTELFEVPKMLFVYLIVIIVATATTIKAIPRKRKDLAINPITISLIFFLIVQVISTITSIDKFTSVFGYPSRLNGGLISQFAYFYLFVLALVNLSKEQVKKLIVASIFTAFLVALWGIPSHFGYDPNCLVLTGNIDASCWQKEFDPTKRIFSTLGQPNWLASYLVLIIPVAISQIIVSHNLQARFVFGASTFLISLAFIFTNSRSGAIGLAVAFIAFIAMLGVEQIKKNLKFLALFLALFLILAAIFGKTLLSRTDEAINPINDPAKGTESTQIRLIVWQGAIEVFKKYPVFGSGPETFAYSYYQVRPLTHNQTTEWNFFYNKAHNEFLNYLANTGIVGFAAYLLFLITIFVTLVKKSSILTKSVLAAIAGYQTTIFFGFSTVTTQMLFYLLIAAALVNDEKNTLLKIKLPIPGRIPQIVLAFSTFIIGLFLVSNVLRLYFADFLVARAKSLSSENPKIIELYKIAIYVFPTNNPFYFAEYANENAYYTANVQMLTADKFAEKALTLAPNNLLVHRRAANAYFLLAQTDQKYEQPAIESAKKLTILAPTDPQSYLSLAKIQAGLDRLDDAKKSTEKALELKPDYIEALELLDQINKRLTTST